MDRAAPAIRDMRGAVDSMLVLNAAKNLMSTRARSAFADLGHAHWAGSAEEGAEGRASAALRDLELAIRRKCARLFGSEHVELRVPTGSVANGIVVASFGAPGATVVVPPKWAFGHKSLWAYGYSEGGRRILEMPWDAASLAPDLNSLRDLMRTSRPSMLVVGSSRPLFAEPLADLASLAREVGAISVYDGSHVLGLIAGGTFPNPLAAGFDILTGSTHKTLPGPLGALVLCRSREQLAMVSATTDAWLSSYNLGSLAALFATLDELDAVGAAYAARVVENARAMATGLTRTGFDVVGARRGATSTHQVLLDITTISEPMTAADRLGNADILINPPARVDARLRGDAPGVWLRLGTSWVTRRGFGPDEMDVLARVLGAILLRQQPAGDHVHTIADLLASHSTLAFTTDQ